MRVVFMGTPDFAVPSLEMLYENNYEIPAVFTQPDRPKGRGKKVQASPVKQKALQYGLDVFQPDKIKTAEPTALLKELRPDVIVVVAFGQLLSQEILDIPRLGCINVHSSLLPAYRGAAPMQWAIINGEKQTGVSTMFMDAGMDTGDILLQDIIEINDDDTFGSVHDRLAVIGAGLLQKTLLLAQQGNLVRKPQDSSLCCYAPLLKKQDELIDWQRSAADIVNHIRGMNPFPGAFTYYNDKVFKLWKAEICQDYNGIAAACGQVVFCDGKKGVIVKTGSGYISLLEVQLQGGKQLKILDFLRGNKMEQDVVLGQRCSE